MGLLDALRDPRFRSDLATNAGQLGQSMSNTIAEGATVPVDALAWLLRKGGLNIPQNPIGGSDWAAQQGLTRQVPQGAPKVAGEAFGLLAPMAATKQGASKIAGGLLDMGENLAKPAMLNKQAGVVPVDFAKNSGVPVRLPDDDIFRQAVGGTKGAQITDEGLLMRVARNQKPEQALNESVRGGVFYLPEGAAQAKHYSTGRNGYGGSEKIAGETLIRNPLFVKGATGGKAPEAAMDSLLGKGAYKAMRTEALSVVPYGASTGMKVEGVERFLEKYAPEMVGQGYEIVKNSKQGNQLAYALQEAAAGSAARNAGYDAILGHSKGKQGAFLSEVFDLREKAYPDAFGTFDTWEQFAK